MTVTRPHADIEQDIRAWRNRDCGQLSMVVPRCTAATQEPSERRAVPQNWAKYSNDALLTLG